MGGIERNGRARTRRRRRVSRAPRAAERGGQCVARAMVVQAEDGGVGAVRWMAGGVIVSGRRSVTMGSDGVTGGKRTWGGREARWWEVAAAAPARSKAKGKGKGQRQNGARAAASGSE